MANKPRPLIVPSSRGGGGGGSSTSRQTGVDLGAIIGLIRLLNKPRKEAQEAQALSDEAQDLGTVLETQRLGKDITPSAQPNVPLENIGTAQEAFDVNLPTAEPGERVFAPAPPKEVQGIQALAAAAGQSKAGVKQLRDLVFGQAKAGLAPAEAPPSPFAKINPKDFTDISVGEFEASIGTEGFPNGDFSKLDAIRPDNVIALANKVDPNKYTKESFGAFQTSLRAGTPDLTLLELDTKEIENRARGGKTTGDIEQSLRKEFTTASKDFVQIRDSFTRINATAQNPSPAGDLAFIFNYMKMLDPGSVVRESEFRTAADAQEFMERKGFTSDALKRIWVGERLSDAARQDFLSKSREIFDGMAALQGKNEETFRRLATDRNINPDNVAIDLGLAEDEEGQGAQAAGEEVSAIDARLAEINKLLEKK